MRDQVVSDPFVREKCIYKIKREKKNIIIREVPIAVDNNENNDTPVYKDEKMYGTVARSIVSMKLPEILV